jgi:hypothetical protein
LVKLVTPAKVLVPVNRYVHVNHDQLITLSTGAAYTFRHTTVHLDAICGGGFYDGFADLDKVPAHRPVSCGIKHDFKVAKLQTLPLRCNVINIFHEIYLYHHGAGIGTTAPYYRSEGGVFAGLDYKF